MDEANLFTILDWVGTIVFAVTGAFRAVKYELDILGVLVLAVATGVGGGVVRDVILGTLPPLAFVNETDLLLCLGGGLLVFFAAPHVARWWSVVKIFDAVGLAVFSAVGSWQGLKHGMGPIGVVMLGTATAVGGGVLRDLLVAEIPAVLTSDFYATAAATGSFAFWLVQTLGCDTELSLLIAAIVTLVLRLLAMRFRFQLPRVKLLPYPPAELARRRPLFKKMHR